MSYVVIARRFRPTRFSEVAGQEVVTRTLSNALELGRIAHAYLFSGTRGVGKTTTARLLAKSLNCEKGVTPDPCQECASCTEVGSGSSMDVLEIDGASNWGINEVRELRESARYAPSRDRYKVFIIDEVHMLTAEAFNALLKIIEEPPSHVVFILATTERDKVPPTILSRCQKLEFRRLGNDEIAASLAATGKELKIDLEPEALAALARAADGSVRDAQSLLEQVIAFAGEAITRTDVEQVLGAVPRELTREALQAIFSQDPGVVLDVIDRLYGAGLDPRLFVTALLEQYRNLILAASGRGETELAELASELTLAELLRSAEVLARLDRELRLASMPRFTLEIALLELCELKRLVPVDQLIENLQNPAPSRNEPRGGPTFRPPGRRGRSAAPTPAPAPSSGGMFSPPPEDSSPPPPATTRSKPRPSATPQPQPSDTQTRFLAEARSALGIRGGFMDDVASAEADGDVLTLTVHRGAEAAADVLRGTEVLDLLRPLAGQVFQGVTSLEVVVGTQEAPASGGSTGPAPPQRPERSAPPAPGPPSPPSEADDGLTREAMGNPLVKRLLDVFQGDVASVTRLQPEKETS